MDLIAHQAIYKIQIILLQRRCLPELLRRRWRPVGQKSADDIHRWRWFGGIKMRILPSVSAKICYFWNEEFNAGLGTNSDINIYNKSKTSIRQPFNSYGAISTAITITF